MDLENLTRIVVTHALDEALLKRYDCVLALKHGSVAQFGSFEALVDHYMGEELLTEEEARGRAFLDTLKEVVLSGFGGFLSGSVSGGIKAGLDSRAGTQAKKAWERATQAEISLVDFLQRKYNDRTKTPLEDGAQDGQGGAETGTPTSEFSERLNADLLTELANSGVKHNPEDIVAAIKTADKKVIWLERGTENAGLNHIISEHSNDFQNKGISQEQIPDYIMAALKTGKIIGYQGKGTGRPIYEFLYNGKLHRVAITVSSNGFVVGANPK